MHAPKSELYHVYNSYDGILLAELSAHRCWMTYLYLSFSQS